MIHWYKRTRISTLVQRCELLHARMERALRPAGALLVSLPMQTAANTTRSSELYWTSDVSAE